MKRMYKVNKYNKWKKEQHKTVNKYNKWKKEQHKT